MTVGLHHEYLVEDLGDDGVPRDFELRCPLGFSFAYDVVDRLGAQTPDRAALRWCDDAGRRETYTFADVARLSDQAAAYLASLGIRKGDRVMLVLKRHAEFWWAMVGLHKIGAVAVPATHQLKAYDLVFRLTEARIGAVVSTLEGDVAGEVEAAEAQIGRTLLKVGVHGRRPGWADLGEGMAAAAAWQRPTGLDATVASDPMLLYFTSGTTAQPKMVVHDFSYPVAHIATAKYWHRVDPEGLHLTVSETGWAKSVWGKLYGQWFLETCVDVYDFDRFDPVRLLEHLVEARVTTFCAAPTVYRFLVQQDLGRYDLSALQHCTIAGEAMNPVVYETFRERTGLELKEGYGQTELTLAVVTHWWQETRPGSMGLPSPAYDVALLGEDGRPVEPGQDGEICIRVPEEGRPLGMFLGYADDEATTRSVWHDGWYHTHDLARADEDGYLWYVGRTDDMIKTSGYRVGPFEVESVVMAHPAVVECAVTAAPDEVRGSVVKATVVLGEGYEAGERLAREIQAFVKERTAPYKYPRVVEFVDALPTTISGKVRRVQLREAGARAAAGQVGPV